MAVPTRTGSTMWARAVARIVSALSAAGLMAAAAWLIAIYFFGDAVDASPWVGVVALALFAMSAVGWYVFYRGRLLGALWYLAYVLVLTGIASFGGSTLVAFAAVSVVLAAVSEAMSTPRIQGTAPRGILRLVSSYAALISANLIAVAVSYEMLFNWRDDGLPFAATLAVACAALTVGIVRTSRPLTVRALGIVVILASWRAASAEYLLALDVACWMVASFAVFVHLPSRTGRTA